MSNYGIHHLEELEQYIKEGGGSAIDVGQYELHPWCDRPDITEWLKKRNVVVEAYSPLAHGYRITEAVLQSIGKKYNKSPAQVMIRWNLQKVSSWPSMHEWTYANVVQGFVPLPKSATPSRIQENAEVFDFELSDEDMKALVTGEYDPTDWDPTVDYD